MEKGGTRVQQKSFHKKQLFSIFFHKKHLFYTFIPLGRRPQTNQVRTPIHFSTSPPPPPPRHKRTIVSGEMTKYVARKRENSTTTIFPLFSRINLFGGSRVPAEARSLGRPAKNARVVGTCPHEGLQPASDDRPPPLQRRNTHAHARERFGTIAHPF